jgi:hypothetical protein
MKEVKKMNVLRTWPFDPSIYPGIEPLGGSGAGPGNPH